MASWREYFACGQVVELEEDGPDVRVEVSGTEEYRVEIRRAGGQRVGLGFGGF